MSFFVKAAAEALKRFPAVNASIDGSDIVYHGYFDIGVAVSTDRGLVVPVLRDADQMSMAEIEAKIAEYANKARSGKLTLEEMQGGTFSITNGGVFGSLLATPIINAPQSAILGMHKIQERPVVENGQIVIRPMMYIALSYDHRIIDGKESVTFSFVIRPPFPVPVTCETSTPCSATALLADGLNDSDEVALVTDVSSCLTVGFAASGFATSAFPPSSMIAMISLAFTTSPLFLIISFKIPSTGHGTSSITLSVSRSTRFSSRET